jgi:hypothetical protein
METNTKRDTLVALVGGFGWLIILAISVGGALIYKGGALTVDADKKTFSFQSKKDVLNELLKESDCTENLGNLSNVLAVCGGKMVLGPATELIDLNDSPALVLHGLIHTKEWKEVSNSLFPQYCDKFQRIIEIGQQCEGWIEIKPVTVSYGAPYSKTIVLQKDGALKYDIGQQCVITIRNRSLPMKVGGIGDLQKVRHIAGRPRIEISQDDFTALAGTTRLGVVAGQLQCGTAQIDASSR